MKKVLILGGSGFVGLHVCEKLVAHEWHLTVLTRRMANAQNLLTLPNLTLLEVDVHDEAALTHALAGHDAVVNLVAILQGDQAQFDRVHLELPKKLARACKAAGVRKLVHLSALGANADNPQAAPSMYLRSKGAGEAALIEAAGAGLNSAFELALLRPSVIFGAEDKFLNVFAELQRVLPVMPLAGAHARFQPVWVEDVAAAVVSCLERGGMAPADAAPRILELCGPEVFELEDLVHLAAQLSGIRGGLGRPVLELPEWAGRLQARLMELAPGTPKMSRDNLDSMRVDNVASGKLPGLESLGITPSALRPIAQEYLTRNQSDHGVLGIRQRAH